MCPLLHLLSLNLNHIIKIPLSIAVYITCILLYLFVGTKSNAWTLFYHCSEKLSMVLFIYLLTQKNKPSYIDRTFLHFGMAVNIVMCGMYLTASISDRVSIIQSFIYLEWIILAGITSLIVWFVYIFIRNRANLE